MKERIIQILGATIEAMGQTPSASALELMANDLSDYPTNEIEAAASKLRRTGGRFSLASLVAMMSGGWIGANEAWSTFPKTEAETGIVTQQAMTAWNAASELFESGDSVAARMAFIETYNRVVAEGPVKPEYTVTLGHDVKQRAGVIKKGLDSGLLTHEQASKYLSSESLIRLENNAPEYHAIEHIVKPKGVLSDGAKERGLKEVEKLKLMFGNTEK